MLTDAIANLKLGRDLTASEMEACVDQFFAGGTPREVIEAFLTQLHLKGESVSELVGGARALRKNAVPVRFTQPILVDTCGTGGDGAGTFNISTAAALVAAACGVKIAKHGNRKITSLTGSADVLVELGVEISCDAAIAQRCLDESGVCFLFAPQFHPAMRHVSEARKALPFPTIFNMLGPLANPAGVTHQVLGVGKAGAWELLVGAMAQLATGTCLAVRGLDGQGELSVLAPSQVAIIEPVARPNPENVLAAVREQVWDAREYGLAGANLGDIQVANPQESAALIRRVLGGEPGTARNTVVWNAAAAVWLTDSSRDLGGAVARCQAAIDSGAARETLLKLGQASRKA
ncbi:MAG: anthranilate phosphoribosyltransferase [Planctomycetaceae bacterium]|nr:anthranilate phosphoribosyltransferase [Planctomycetaceae bacterium]